MDPFLTLFWILVGPMLACFSFFGPCLVPPWASAGPPFASSNVFCHLGGAIAGSWVPFCSSFEAICCSRAPFLASTWHLFGRFRGQFDAHQFFPMHCIQTRNRSASSNDNSKSCTSPSESVLHICLKKCPAYSSCRAKRGTYV